MKNTLILVLLMCITLECVPTNYIQKTYKVRITDTPKKIRRPKLQN